MATAPTIEQLATPTVGAWQRAHNVDGWSEEARHLYAITAVNEALRDLIIDRLDSISLFLQNGATPDQAITRLSALLAEYYRAAP